MRPRLHVVLALFLATACASSPTTSGDESTTRASAATEVEAGASSAPTATRATKVVLKPAKGTPVEVSVEVVQSSREIQRGLMYRRYLPPDVGMLFLMGPERVHTFWMRNTLIPLDMIFIGKDKRIVGIVERAEPLTDTQRTVGKPSSYVLEVNGGYTAAHGLAAGDLVEFIDIIDETTATAP